MRFPIYHLSLVGLLLLQASGVAAQLDYGHTVPAGAVDGDLILSPCEVYHPGDDKSYPGDCGTLVVSENRRAANARLIALPISRIRATGENPLEPIF